MKTVKVRVPATSANLGPGFDVLGMALNLYNEFTFCLRTQSAGAGLCISKTGEGSEDIPSDERNLVYRAFKTVLTRTGGRVPPLEIGINNRIPLSRGLGSSATAIIGGILGANTLFGNPLSESEILILATQIEGHPDNVTPAFSGGITVTMGQAGAGFRYQKIDPPRDLIAIVLVPDYTLDTRAAREVLPEEVPFKDAVFNIGRVASLVAALTMNRVDLIAHTCADRMHEPYREHLVAGFKAVREAGLRAGALAVCLSGAGPSIIALVNRRRSDVGNIAGAMKQALAVNSSTDARALVLRPEPAGARVEVAGY